MNDYNDQQNMFGGWPQMPVDRVSASCCGKREAAGRIQRCIWEPRREVKEADKSAPSTVKADRDNMSIGIAYVPWQKWGATYPIDEGLNRGTIFPELDLPFVMGRCR